VNSQVVAFLQDFRNVRPQLTSILQELPYSFDSMSLEDLRQLSQEGLSDGRVEIEVQDDLDFAIQVVVEHLSEYTWTKLSEKKTWNNRDWFFFYFRLCELFTGHELEDRIGHFRDVIRIAFDANRRFGLKVSKGQLPNVQFRAKKLIRDKWNKTADILKL
jgi:hypothetical protein